MARYTEARCKLCRRAGDKLFLKGAKCLSPKCIWERRGISQGRRPTPRSRLSERGLQLREKQKAKQIYGVLERQFRRFFAMAEKLPGPAGENLLQLLERRLDNVAYRLGFASSKAQARQLVMHGHFDVNGRKTDIPSFLVKAGDVITWHKGSEETEYYKQLLKAPVAQPLPAWLTLDKEKMIGKVLSLPKREELEIKVNEKAIVEYYAR